MSANIGFCLSLNHKDLFLLLSDEFCWFAILFNFSSPAFKVVWLSCPSVDFWPIPIIMKLSVAVDPLSILKLGAKLLVSIKEIYDFIAYDYYKCCVQIENCFLNFYFGFKMKNCFLYGPIIYWSWLSKYFLFSKLFQFSSH